MVDDNASDDVIVEQDGVQPEGADVDNTSGDGIADPPKKEPDDYWKNKAYEFERKANLYEETRKELKEIKEMISNQKSSSESQYSEEQLQAALANPDIAPEQRSYIQSEIRKLQQKQMEDRDKRIIEEARRLQKEELTRQQAEQQIINDPRFQEAFVKLPNGTVQWNQSNELAQTIGSYMNDPRLKGQPDSIAIAAKLAYADVMASRGHEQAKVKRQNEQLKSQTMVEGGGKNFNKPKVDPYQENLQRLKEGDKYAAHNAVKAYLQKRDAKK